jgi:hypothetical protein
VGLVKMIPLEFRQKIQHGGDIRVGQNSNFFKYLLRLHYSKVLKFSRRAFWKIFINGGTVQDGGFSTFYFQKEKIA